jgi:hypothetical protein
MELAPTDYSIYFTHIGGGYQQLFIKNISAEADFIRIILGYTELVRGKREGKVINSWIISPLKPEGEHVFIYSLPKYLLANRRMWVAFEAVRRGHKNVVVGSFMALSPTASRLRKTIGASTYFEIKSIERGAYISYNLLPISA